MTVDAFKVGFVGDASMVQDVAEALKRARDGHAAPLVVDPGCVDKHGERRCGDALFVVLKQHLLTAAQVVVVNCYEAELFLGRRVGGQGSIQDALRALFDIGGGLVVVHGPPGERHAVSYAYDGSGVVEFGRDRIAQDHLRGSGEVFSAALTGFLAHGAEAMAAVESAKKMITAVVGEAVHIGKGERPVHALAALYRSARLRINTISIEDD